MFQNKKEEILKSCSTPYMFASSAGEEVVTVNTPAFAESVTEGDVRWEKGKNLLLL